MSKGYDGNNDSMGKGTFYTAASGLGAGRRVAHGHAQMVESL